jgi:hypothetical protein
MRESHVILRIQNPVNQTLFRAEIFRTSYSQVDLSVGKISGGNIIIRFLGIYHAIS